MNFNKHETLSEKISRILTDQIIRNEIKAGERLLEIKIAEELGVSQSPVREALRILEKKKFVKIYPRHGTNVTEITEPFIESIYDIFAELVALATRKTTERRTDEDIIEIRKALRQVEIHAENGDVYNFNNYFFEWGLTCLKAAYDPILSEMLLDLTPSITRVQYTSLINRGVDEIRAGFKKIQYTTKCIEDGNIEEAAMNNKLELLNEKINAIEIFRKRKINLQAD